jgi:hypothetical protein
MGGPRSGEDMTRRDALLDVINVLLAMLAGAAYCWAGDPPKVEAIVFSQPDCAPCQKMKRAFAGSGLPVRFEERSSELSRFKIKSTPTTIIFVGGKPTLQKVGMLSVQAMRELLARD